MATRVQDLIDQARLLPPEEQIALLTALHNLVAPVDPQCEDAWVRECLERLDAHARGDMESADSDRAMAALCKGQGLL